MGATQLRIELVNASTKQCLAYLDKSGCQRKKLGNPQTLSQWTKRNQLLMPITLKLSCVPFHHCKRNKVRAVQCHGPVVICQNLLQEDLQ